MGSKDTDAMGEQKAAHWDDVYGRKGAKNVSWFQPSLQVSLSLIEQIGLANNASIIDVGGGASTLVDDLLGRGFSDLTVLDLSKRALEETKCRLGPRAGGIEWRQEDITKVDLGEKRFDLWHDRAVFHFLTDATARRRYVRTALRALKPGGHIIVACFGPQGPDQCSGLDIVRYDPGSLHREFGSKFEKLKSVEEIHKTPWGKDQEFIYCYCRRV